MKRKKHMQRGRERRKPIASFPANFAVGNRVRVKPGTTDPDFEDIPLGGWSGTIREIDRRGYPPTYLIEWDRPTLNHMHPVYRSRCERDGLVLESMWLGENDLELNSGRSVAIEQPSHLVTRPLSSHDQDDRIRAIFGLTSDDPLPPATVENLRRYARHLKTHLSFPFPAMTFVDAPSFQPKDAALSTCKAPGKQGFVEKTGENMIAKSVKVHE